MLLMRLMFARDKRARFAAEDVALEVPLSFMPSDAVDAACVPCRRRTASTTSLATVA